MNTFAKKSKVELRKPWNGLWYEWHIPLITERKLGKVKVVEMTTVQGIQLRVTMHAFSMPKRQIPFLSSVLRGDIQNYCKFELQSPDNMAIVNKLLYIDSHYLASMVIFSNVLKRWLWNNFLAKSCFKTTFHHGSLR